MTTPSPTTSSRAQVLAPALIALLVVVGLSPFADVVITQWPIHLGDDARRFQFLGLLFAAGPQVCLVIVLIAATGLIAGSRTTVRGAAIALLVVAILFIPMLPVFGLDYLQVRRLVGENAKKLFDLAAIKTILFVIVLIPLAMWTGLRGLRVTPTPAVAGRHQRTKGEGLIVAQDGEK